MGIYGNPLTQSAGVTHISCTLSIFASTQAPFQTKDRGSTSFGGGKICTFSMFFTSGVAIACNLRKKKTWRGPQQCGVVSLMRFRVDGGDRETYLLSNACAIPGIR